MGLFTKIHSAKGSQYNEGENRGKEKIEEKAFQNWQWALFFTLNQSLFRL